MSVFLHWKILFYANEIFELLSHALNNINKLKTLAYGKSLQMIVIKVHLKYYAFKIGFWVV